MPTSSSVADRETWAEDDDGSAALLHRHAARAGASARIELTAADLPGKLALVATGHAIALIPGVLTRGLRTDATMVSLVDPPTRGVYTVVPRRDPHPCAAAPLDHLATAFASVRPGHDGVTSGPGVAAHRQGPTAR